ncbi:MAG: amino acid adenylation domain-containing protein, partial [Candidatus Latescibacteria bacterium]|nr:amino acid adenylation domain-containing protein [Candidatus Latescibacterota bacterium]
MDKRLTYSVFESVVDSYPENISVDAPEGVLTYSELDRAANAIANCLIKRDFKMGAIAAVFIPNSAAYISSVLGVQKAGGVFMPTDPEAPFERQSRMLAKAEPDIVIVNEENLPLYRRFCDHSGFKPRLLLVTEPKAPVRIYLSNMDEHIEIQPEYTRPGILPDPDDDLYVIFTSGTTGNPKAVLGRQKGLAHFIDWERSEFRLDGSVRVSNLAPTTFDVSLRDIFVPLTAGGTVFVPPQNVVSTPGVLLDWLSGRKINLIHIVPSVFRLLLDELEKRPDHLKLITHMKYIMLAGEVVYGRDVIRFREITGNSVHLVNLYGPSETTLAKLFCRLDFLPENPGRIMPLGNPISNTAVIILKNNRLAEIGEIGEICIKTPFRSKGYFREPELTAKAFVANPLTGDQEDIIYRTGDMGRYMSDRSVEYVGRVDRQVKVNGVRVELSEVDEAVHSYPDINQALVMPHI